MSGLWRTKSVEQSIQDTDEPGHKLKRTLSAPSVTVDWQPCTNVTVSGPK